MPESPSAQTMTSREVAEAMYTALLRSDRDALQAITSPDITINVTKELPYGGTYSGFTGFGTFFMNTFDRIESTIEIERFFDAGSQVVAVGRTRGAARTTGQHFDAAILHVLTVRDGKLTGFDAFVEDTPINSAINGTPHS